MYFTQYLPGNDPISPPKSLLTMMFLLSGDLSVFFVRPKHQETVKTPRCVLPSSNKKPPECMSSFLREDGTRGGGTKIRCCVY